MWEWEHKGPGDKYLWDGVNGDAWVWGKGGDSMIRGKKARLIRKTGKGSNDT